MIYGFELESNETNKNQNRLYILFFGGSSFFFVSSSSSAIVVALTNDNGNGNGGHSTFNPNPLRPTSSGIIEARN